MDIISTIDHTNLDADATKDDIQKTCQEVIDYGFRAVDINSYWVKVAKEVLKDTEFKLVTVIDWPNGAAPTKVRVCQAEQAKEDGADEIDPVINIGNIKMGNYEKVAEDLEKLSNILPVKIILETGYLTEKEIFDVSKLAKEAGVYCVKTSTGVPPKVDIPTKIEHVKIMRKAVPGLKIKAAGGIRTYKDAKKLIEAGADIIGTSTGVQIANDQSSSTNN